MDSSDVPAVRHAWADSTDACAMRTELANMRSGETMGATYDVSVQELSARYATAIRGLIEDPYRLPHPIE